MVKKTMIALGLLICFLVSIPTISAFNEQISEHSIRITELDDSYQIREKIIYISPANLNNSFYDFQLPTQADELKVYVENTIINNYTTNNGIYTINLSSFNITSDTITIDLSYFIPLSTTLFSKTISYNTSTLQIYFDDVQYASNTDQLKDTTFQLRLIKSTEQASLQYYTIILIVLLVVIIIVTVWYGFFKKKNGQTRKRIFESSEVLTTEKKLLLDVLKEIEKMHRNQKISDDSYHKLKTHYKQQTVEIMSTLEDMKSK